MLCRGPFHYLSDPLGWRLPRKALVLDVGSGQKPMWRADVLVERYLDDSSQRPGPLCVARPLICRDIEALPLKDKAFDFIYCSHVLEHVSDPERAARELGRVGKAGIIAVPSYHWEKQRNEPTHRWLCRTDGDIVILSPKPASPREIPAVDDGEEIVYKWAGSPNVVVEPLIRITNEQTWSQPLTLYSAEINPSQTPRKHRLRHMGRCIMVDVGNVMHHVFSAHRHIDVVPLLQCPRCAGSVTRSGETLTCAQCEAGFRISNGIPIMLPEEREALQ